MKYIFQILLLLTFTIQVASQQNQAQNQIQTQSNLAFQYYNARDFEKAAPSMLIVYDLTKNSTYFKYYLDCLIQLNKFDEACAKVQQEIKRQKFPEPEYYIHWGYILKTQGNLEEAKIKYENALALIPQNKNAYLIAANAFLGWAEYELAKNTYLKGETVLGAGEFDYELARAYSYVRDYHNMMEKYLDLLKQAEENLPRVESSLASAMRLDIDDELLESFREQALKRIQSNPEIIGYNRLLIWLFLQEGKFSNALRQSIALDKRTGAEDDQIIQLGNMALNNKKYDDAIKAFDYLIGKGAERPHYPLAFSYKIHTSYLNFVSTMPGNIAEGQKLAAEFEKGLEILGLAPANIFLIIENVHLLAFYLDRISEAIVLLNKALEIPRLKPEEWGYLKTELADIYIYSGDPWEATLLYSQVIDANKNNSLGDDVKLKKAKLGYYLGNFSWAKAQLDVLKASTSKLTANDAMELSLLIGNNLSLDTTAAPLEMFARADLLFFQNKNELAIAKLDSLAEMYPYHSLVDDILFRKAKIEIEKSNYALAAEQLQKIVDGFGYDLLGDDATFILAELCNNNLNQKEKAKEFYKLVLTSYPGSVFTEESREKYRELRAIYPDKEPEPTKEELFMNGERI
jgi:hypothetical protein